MDIGEHPASIKGKVWIFTNADSVKMYRNDKFIKEYVPCSKHFPSMVKTTGEKGKAKVKISCPRVEDKIIEFEVV